MSYESKLDNRSGKFISPTQLCLLLSVALHLLVLRFGLPTIRFNNDSGRREVSIIELNPEQQSRLPDLYPQLDTPDVPDISNLPEPDNSDPVAPFAIPPSLIPGVGDNSNLPALTIPPPPQFNLPPLPPQTDITLPPIGDLSTLPLPPQIEPSDFKADPIKLPPNTGKTPPQPSSATVETQPTQPPQPTTTTKPEPEETKPLPPPQLTPEQIAAKKLADSQERINKLRESLTKTEAGTTNEDARKNYVAWLAKIEDIEPDKIEIEGAYPRDACIRRLEGTSVFGVVTNQQGQVVALDLIKGAKYALFNQQASQELGDRTLDNPTDKPKPYQVTVNYKYDAEICPSLTLPSIRNQEQQPQSEPQPQPEAEAEVAPKPEVQPEPKAETTPEPEVQPEPEPEAETTPKPEVQPEPEPEAETTPKPEVQPEPEPEAETTPKPEVQPEPEPKPSLRDRLRDVPLRDLNPAKLKDIPLPKRSNFGE